MAESTSESDAALVRDGSVDPVGGTTVAPVEPVDGSVGGVEKTGESKQEPWWTRYTTALTEHAQDVVSALVAALLIALAGAILVASIVNFFTSTRGLQIRATDFLDNMLLVLILVEIVHTVVLSLRAHALAAQPFIVVGLVAVIRKILFALGSQQKLDPTTLGIYVAMVAVFVSALVAIEVFGGRGGPKGRSKDPRVGLH